MKTVPWFSISSEFQPAADAEEEAAARQASRVATSLAVVMVSRSMIRQMPVPILSRFVAAAAAISETNGS